MKLTIEYEPEPGGVNSVTDESGAVVAKVTGAKFAGEGDVEWQIPVVIELMPEEPGFLAQLKAALNFA